MVNNYSNPDFAHIYYLGRYSGLRLSEVIFLDYSMLKGNSILLHSKGKLRNHWIPNEAVNYLKSNFDMSNKSGRLFNYTRGGFEKVWREQLKKHDITFNYHSLRKEFISAFIESFSGMGSIQMARSLGLSSVRKFENTHLLINRSVEITDQPSLLKSVGHHPSGQVTLDHYYVEKAVDNDKN